MDTVLSVESVNKIYSGGFQALENINLSINKGEIFALLGPNGAGKTTLIGAICGLVKLTSGKITIDGFDHQRDFRSARSKIGLVPQELTTDAFERVIDTVAFSQGLFGLKKDIEYVDKLLKDFSLFDKRNNKLMTLSGGMKRRVMIAKALAHKPEILFLDEPTAGVDVQLRESMWEQIHCLKERGVTIILTTHYIEEAEKMADRIGIINKGKIVQVDEKKSLIKRLGQKTIQIAYDGSLEGQALQDLQSIPNLKLDGQLINYEYQSTSAVEEVPKLFKVLVDHKIPFSEVESKEKSLQDIFVDLVRE